MAGDGEVGVAVDQRGVTFKVITLLEELARVEDGVSVREVARDTGMDKSTVSRLFGQLEALDVVQQSPVTGRYEVGHRLSSLGELLHTHNTLWGLAEPVVRGLVEQFDETCYLIERDVNQARFRQRIDCRQAVRYIIEPGQVSPLYAGAAGRSILAGMDPQDAERYLADVSLTGVTSQTLTDRDVLRTLVAEDRRRGYSVSAGERVPGGHGVGAPVFRADGDCVAAILWTCPSSRFDATRVQVFGVAVQAASAELSRRLGYVRSP